MRQTTGCTPPIGWGPVAAVGPETLEREESNMLFDKQHIMSMISDPQQIGGRRAAGAAGGVPSSGVLAIEKGSILDMFGCTTRR